MDDHVFAWAVRHPLLQSQRNFENMNTVIASFLEDFLAFEVDIGHDRHQANPLIAAAAVDAVVVVIAVVADTFVGGEDAYYRV